MGPHLTWSSQQQDGLPVCRAKEVPLFLGYSKTLSISPVPGLEPSSETQGQIVGAREILNGRKNMARRKVKNGEKSPWGQCLT